MTTTDQTTIPTITGLTAEQTARVEAHGLTAKIKKLSLSKRSDAADKLLADPDEEIAAAFQAMEPYPEDVQPTVTAPMIQALLTDTTHNAVTGDEIEAAPANMTYGELCGVIIGMGFSPMDLVGRTAADLALILDFKGSITAAPEIQPLAGVADDHNDPRNRTATKIVPLHDGRRRAHYEADAEGQAMHNSAAARHGERVTYAPFAWGGEAHLTIALVLWDKLGKRAGDRVSHLDMGHIPGKSATQRRYGSEASMKTCMHRLANAGMIRRLVAEGSKRAAGYVVTGEFFERAACMAEALGYQEPAWLEMLTTCGGAGDEADEADLDLEICEA